MNTNIPKKDLKVERYRATGNGGQNVNKVESAVRITHLPTGLVAQSQDERSQKQNYNKAMSVLLSRIDEREKREKHDKLNEFRQQALDNGRIRTYNYITKMVTDHRTGKQYRLQDFADAKINFMELPYAQDERLAKRKDNKT
jgi:peptide chain release factor 1